MPKKLITIGYEIPGYSDVCVPLKSDQSLLDYDVILFQPDISAFYSEYPNFYQGKHSLYESSSFQLREAAARWRNALREAFSHGKTVFVFMSAIEEVFLDTGRREYSGTGRNRQTTNIVEEFDNYSMLPMSFSELKTARGREIKAAGDLKVLAEYWATFGSSSSYEVYFASKSVAPLLVTRTGDKAVGGIARDHSGAMILLPVLHYDRTRFIDKKDNKQYWNKEGLKFGRQLANSLLEIDRTLGASRELSPPPQWSRDPKYRLSAESVLELSISKLTEEIERSQIEHAKLSAALENAGQLRRLLFEKGPALEDAILEALTILGLKAERFKDTESEFDAVFVWNNTRFLGEAEGKDNKPIAIDKISQLERNLNEDFAREDVSQFAKGILFGNAFRLQEPSARDEYFTDKCISSATRLKAALIRTPDLFVVAKYVRETSDSDYAAKCVEAIGQAEGTIVRFPSVPATDSEASTKVK